MLLKAAPGRAGLMLLKGEASPRVMLNARGLSELARFQMRRLRFKKIGSLRSPAAIILLLASLAKENKNCISLGHELPTASFYDAQSVYMLNLTTH